MADANPYRVLYYPDFEPNLLWLRSILLLTDEVVRIVPKDASYVDSSEMVELKKWLPGVVTEFAPTGDDIALGDLNLGRLEKAFGLIREREPNPNTRTITFARKGTISIEGFAFLHEQKVSHKVRDLLEKNQLVDVALTDTIAHTAGHKEYLIVNKAASDLILSCLADRIARTNGFDTITDQNLLFSMNGLNALGAARLRDAGAAEGLVMSAIASASIPAETANLNWKEYKQLHDSYGELRVAFQLLTRELVIGNRLDRLENPEALKARVEGIAEDFDNAVKEYRRTRYARRFREWSPLYVGGILSVTTAFVSPPVAATLAGISVVVQFIDKMMNISGPPSLKEKCCRMVGDLSDDALDMHYHKALL